MKYITICLALLTFSLGANEKLLKSVPKDCNIVIGLKVSELLKLPIVKENLKNIPSTSEVDDIKPENIKGMVIGLKAQSEMELTGMAEDPHFFMALETVTTVKLADVLKLVSDENIKVTKKTYLNKEYFEGVSEGKAFGVHQISDKSFIIGSKDLLLKGIALTTSAGQSIMDSNIMKKLLKTDGGVLYAGGFLSQSPDFKGFALLANYKKGIKLNTRLYCKKAEKAKELAMQANAMIPVVTSNPQMGIKPEDIKISSSGTSLVISAFVSENTLKQIPVMIQSMFMQNMPQE